MQKDSSTPPAGRDAIRRLDRILNYRLLAAADDAEAQRWWQVKVSIKRRLERVADADIDRAAADLLRALREVA